QSNFGFFRLRMNLTPSLPYKLPVNIRGISVSENLILNSIAWPKIPPLLPPRSINDTSDPAHSSFIILPKKGGGQWIVGDQLKVRIKMFDYHGHPKKYGGDFILARLHSPALDAGVAGQVLDHLNGTYSVVFPLLWEGSAQVEMTLVHPSEAVAVLHWLTYYQPDRLDYNTQFRSGSVRETTICNICLPPTQEPICDYTDVRTGEPWFCYKPKTLSCDHKITAVYLSISYRKRVMQTNIGCRSKFCTCTCAVRHLILCFFPQRRQPKSLHWNIRTCSSHCFNTTSAITECLKNKEIHMYGDSTIRQWFQYLLKKLDFQSSYPKSGPFFALDSENNIKVTFRCHGPPIRFSVSTIEMHYIANELNEVAGGPNTVIIIGIWAHVITFPVEMYIRRLMTIRKAVLRLLTRAPDTLIIIRTANPKDLARFEEIFASDWYIMQHDKVLRTIFKGINVHLVDAWEMTLAHWLPHNTHPEPPIISNMMNAVFSSICPGNSS
uniref:Neurexophilin and PC-esterase domain family, member 3 n=1 Tax=Salarias fasciatus TaxID=181472 RepID=A0A672HF74_SALFA